jgi:integral membrane sensor domain MASE1
LLAFLASLELRRITTGPAQVPLLPIAPGLLLVAIAVVPSSRRAVLIALAAVGSFLSALVIGSDSVPLSLVRAGADVLGACAGACFLRSRGTDIRAVWTVRGALHLIGAAILDGLVTASAWTVGAVAIVPPSALLSLWHLHLVSTLFGISVVIPMAMVFARRRFLHFDLRGLELSVVLGSVIVATYFMWTGPRYPRPGLLAPFLVWAALRHPLEVGLVNVTFALTSVATMHWHGSSWRGFGTSSDILIGLWIYLLVNGAFLVLGTNIVERRRSQHLMQRVLDGVSDGIVVVDARGAVRAMNRSASSMFKLHAQDTEGVQIERWLPSVWSAKESEIVVADLEVTPRAATAPRSLRVYHSRPCRPTTSGTRSLSCAISPTCAKLSSRSR